MTRSAHDAAVAWQEVAITRTTERDEARAEAERLRAVLDATLDEVAKQPWGFCRDCRYWFAEPAEDHRCLLADCEAGQPGHRESKALAQDSEEYSAWLITAPDFGCNQWGAKP